MGSTPIFEALYEDEEKLRSFLNAMGGLQMGNFSMFSKEFDFKKYKTHCDIGGAGGHLACQVAINNPHMFCLSYDLLTVEPIAIENIKMMGLSDRVLTQSGNFFEEPLPKADMITMGNILHDWGIKDKKMLIKKAYDSLPQGGVLVVIENIIDDHRRKNVFGLMMSLHMNLETLEGFDFSAADFNEWAKEAGFTKTVLMPLIGPSSAVIAIK